jgi:hypothetical protein
MQNTNKLVVIPLYIQNRGENKKQRGFKLFCHNVLCRTLCGILSTHSYMQLSAFMCNLRIQRKIHISQIFTTCFSWQLILEAKATAVCLNKDYYPTRIPRELLSKMQLLSVDSRGSNEDVNNRNNSCN